MQEVSSQRDQEALLALIRPAVRQQKPYVVGQPPHIQVKLNQNESPFGLPEDLKEELAAAYRALAPNRYPTEQPHALRHALSDALGHPADGILIGNGSNELTHTLGLTMIAPGTAVVLPTPMFSLYRLVVHLFDGALTEVAPRPDLSFDVPALCAALRQVRPTLTVVTTPNNPTGLALPLDAVEDLVRRAEGFVVVDEAYVEFSAEESALALLPRYPNLLVMRTFSKAYGLAGLRLGYLLGDPAVIGEMLKARLPFMVDRLAEATAIALLRRPALIAERVALLKDETQNLTTNLAALPGVHVVPSQTNFVVFKTGMEPERLMDRLAESGILVRNMGGYPALRGYLRVNAGTPAENKAFMVALKRAILT